VRFDDPQLVREQYATEDGLAARASLYLDGCSGPDARDVVLEELARLAPQRLLEVGCGWGELAERIERELGCSVVATDQSPRMVELARERNLDARVADVRELPFRDAGFDAVVAAWMLYHVRGLDRALAEVARVLRPGGSLVAVTNGAADFHELWTLLGRDLSERRLTFRSENGAELLAPHFALVERHDLETPVTFRDSEAMRRYVGSSPVDGALAERVPDLQEPFVATKLVTVFVATR
jgi:SAM-dependent methyltransferase